MEPMLTPGSTQKTDMQRSKTPLSPKNVNIGFIVTGQAVTIQQSDSVQKKKETTPKMIDGIISHETTFREI